MLPMPKNQLFRQIPPKEVCVMVLETFGIINLHEGATFSRYDLQLRHSVEKMEEIKPLLLSYYLPCKARTYLHDLNEKNIITILRQLLRMHGYVIASREKYRKGSKYIQYQLLPDTDDLPEKKKKPKKPSTSSTPLSTAMDMITPPTPFPSPTLSAIRTLPPCVVSFL